MLVEFHKNFSKSFLTLKETELDDAVSALEEIWFAKKRDLTRKLRS